MSNIWKSSLTRQNILNQNKQKKFSLLPNKLNVTKIMENMETYFQNMKTPGVNLLQHWNHLKKMIFLTFWSTHLQIV